MTTHRLTRPFVASISLTGLSRTLATKQNVSGEVVLAVGYHAVACTASGWAIAFPLRDESSRSVLLVPSVRQGLQQGGSSYSNIVIIRSSSVVKIADPSIHLYAYSADS